MKSALLVIDVQKEFIIDIFNRQKIICQIKKLIDFFKKRKWLVIFIQDFHSSKKDKEFEKWGCHALKGTKGVEYIDELKPGKKNLVIKKKRYSAFFDTKLNKILRKNKIFKIFLVGIYTDFCVLATALDAYMRDYDVFVIADATGTKSLARHRQILKQIKILAAKKNRFDKTSFKW